MHVVLDGADILMSQQLLQAEDVATEHEVAHRESVPEDMSTDTLALDTGAIAQALEEHLDPVNSEGLAAL